MEAALILAEAEYRKFLYFLVFDVRDAFGIQQIVAALLFSSLEDVPSELLGAFIREYLVKPFADFLQVVHQHGILLIASGLEVHVDFIFGQAAGHQFAIGRDDVSPGRRDGHIFLDEAVGYIFPVLSFGKHDESRFHNNAYGHQCKEQHESRIAQHNFFLFRYHAYFSLIR